MVQSPLPVIPAAGSDIFSLKGKYKRVCHGTYDTPSFLYFAASEIMINYCCLSISS